LYGQGFPDTITPEVDEFVRKLSLQLRQHSVSGLQETLQLMAMIIEEVFANDRRITWRIGNIQIISANSEPTIVWSGAAESDRVAHISRLSYAHMT